MDGEVSMKDAFGKEVNVGDKVVYIRKEYSQGPIKLAKGTIKEIKGRIIKVTGHDYGVMSQSVMKIEKE
jgi:hypothetical protein